jgi:hypothetical protein
MILTLPLFIPTPELPLPILLLSNFTHAQVNFLLTSLGPPACIRGKCFVGLVAMSWKMRITYSFTVTNSRTFETSILIHYSPTLNAS